MSREIHPSTQRGISHHGWLHSYHSFSFGRYHNPERMGFGTLLVLNDDRVAPEMGFAPHEHNNMEIVSIPLTGRLRHEDSLGNRHVIATGEVQILSAGRGVSHSEYNDSSEGEVHFLQIWVLPNTLDSAPSYGQKAFDATLRHNRWQTVVSPDGQQESLSIKQDAFFSLADFDAGETLFYEQHRAENGVFLFVIEGQVQVDLDTLNIGDALGITDQTPIEIRAHQASRLLCIEVPMTLAAPHAHP
jgi:hypothetical protein